ncbi:LysA protein [Mycolicibacterium madagascariense]|uniref:LysA protein n=1 Tax=Mycolicibacterium madagascariense TaxID=212765 RepID=A0A7I7XLN1_9MYCO|nr:hypothetical protein [Mycolicibacterium madagascariense]MCV7012471.1 hypothetical protein [Mycolicibacterium madagascariense]BBZ30148.1 LysA protein [Mycolicibacterium madagascariense]
MTTFDLPHSTAAPSRLGVPGHSNDRLALYRRVFREAAIVCPADVLARTGMAAAVRTHGHGVEVRSLDQLAVATSLGIPASRIVLQDDGTTAAPIRRGVDAGVGRIVLACSEQVKVLASCAMRRQRIMLDVKADAVDAVLACTRLELVGLHARLAPAAGVPDYVDVVAEMVAHMAWIRRRHRLITTRVSLGGGRLLSDTAEPSELRDFDAALEDAFDDACARFRFPRPALILTPWCDGRPVPISARGEELWHVP